MKFIIVLLLFFVLVSLASALYYVVKDKGHGTRAVRSLTFRVGLSLLVFTLLMVGTYIGLIPL
ncbi:twin transmembrane helix small protein [Nitrosovibrio sp. Nv17]|uniref:twin transmembrane helix small protein n=1 Tax=Nitrosovibrio sp. Nv17 TaxID=1855339 RepID=UPI000908681F|nr:twin transmembrane helix small protein [Nitrosovibrio sp. Nv17]SFW33279.1 Protein of unknown function [Nitrosovibrio sp. Nv17]